MAVSFIGGGNHIMLYREHLTCAALELTTILMKNTGCIGSCKSYCHTITTTTVPYGISILFLFNKPKRQSKMDNPEKRATSGTQDTRHKTMTNKAKIQHNICWTTIWANEHK